MAAETSLAGVLVRSVSLGLIIAGGGAGAVLVLSGCLKHPELRRPPHAHLAALTAYDLVRAMLCLPFVLTTVLHRQHWVYGDGLCVALASTAAFCQVGGAITGLSLAFDRYLANLHTRFHARRINRVAMTAGALSLSAAMALAVALPSVFDASIEFVPAEAQCIVRPEKSVGVPVLLMPVFLLTFALYFRVYVFMHSRRRMRPIVIRPPVVSDSWSFRRVPINFNPGSSVATTADPTVSTITVPLHPLAMATRTATRAATAVIVALPASVAARQRHLTRLCVAVSAVYWALWLPYVAAGVWMVAGTAPVARPTDWVAALAAWLTYAQTVAVPAAYFTFCPTFRRPCLDKRVGRIGRTGVPS